jgi:hypothetical protein
VCLKPQHLHPGCRSSGEDEERTAGHWVLPDLFACDLRQRIAAAVAVRLLPSGGLIVDSGHSYHLVGSHPVTPDGLIDFLARASLFGSIVDRAYIAHQILERRCALRISRGGHSGAEPRVQIAF